MRDFEAALGQYILYRNLINFTEPDYQIYLAIKESAYENFFTRESIQEIIKIKKILTEYHHWASGSSNMDDEICLIFDETHDHYLWLFLGWEGKKKVKNTQVHIRIKQGRIWIEEDWTETGITDDLLKEGVPKSDIVLAFYPLEERQLTEFATA